MENSFPELTTVLQNGGNVAAMIAVYVGLRVLDAVKKFLGRVASTIERSEETHNRVIKALEKVEAKL